MAFYWPIYLWGPWQAIRAGHPCFFSALNPGIEGGGIGFESKYEIGELIPERWRPFTIRVLPGMSLDQICTSAGLSRAPQGEDSRGGSQKLSYPLIAKPDIGYRGRLVQVIHNEEALRSYLAKYPLATLLQEKIELPEEIGLFYYRRPGQAKGTISSLTTKRFLSVTGDGQRSIGQLLEQDERSRRQKNRLQRELGDKFQYIPQQAEVIRLGEIGNHNLGTQFIDARDQITAALIDRFDQVANEIPNFCYGRFDLRADSLAAIEAGEFKILEINGALGEPTHLYDTRFNNYFTAVRDIMAHWQVIGTISRDNMRRGVQPMGIRKMLRKLFEFRAYAKKVKRLSKLE
ncbi:MAG: hypothetical protein AAF433_11005 [Bacteroidota bacterium]